MPPSLTLLVEALEECSSDIVHADLAHLQRLLKKTPLGNDMIIKQIKFLCSGMTQATYATTASWYGEANVTLARGGSSSCETALDRDEEKALSILQRVEAVCSKVSVDLKAVNNSRAELVDYRETATAPGGKFTLKAEHEQHVKEARMHDGELLRFEAMASGNLDQL